MNNIYKVTSVISVITFISLVTYGIYSLIKPMNLLMENGVYVMFIFFLSVIFGSISLFSYFKIRKI